MSDRTVIKTPQEAHLHYSIFFILSSILLRLLFAITRWRNWLDWDCRFGWCVYSFGSQKDKEHGREHDGPQAAHSLKCAASSFANTSNTLSTNWSTSPRRDPQS